MTSGLLKKLQSGFLAVFLSALMFSLSSLAAPDTSCRQVFLTKTDVKSRNKAIVLFPDRKFHENYTSVVANLKRGDWLTLPSGRSLKIQKIVGQGQLTKVIDIGDGWLLRIPLSDDDRYALESIRGFQRLQLELAAEGIRTVEVDAVRSEPPFALVVKKENLLFTGSEFFRYQKKGWPPQFSKLQIKTAQKQFGEFMKKTWRYTDISDVTPRQMLFNGEEWVLFDFYGFGSPSQDPLRNFDEKEIIMHARSYEDPDSPHSISERFMPANLEKKLSQKINKIREQQAESGVWYERSSVDTGSESELIDRVTPHPISEGWEKSFSVSKYFWFTRAFSGYRPRDEKIIIKIGKLMRVKKNWAIYEALINDKFVVQVHLLIDAKPADYWKSIHAMEKKAKDDHATYLSGSDFILYYDSKDSKSLQTI